MNRKLNAIYKLVLLIIFLTSVSAAVSVRISSVDGKGASSVNVNYDVDHSSYLAQRLVLGNGWISSSLSIKGSGSNKIDQTAGNEEASVSSSIDSIGALSSTASGYASADIVQVRHNIQSAGQSDSSVSGASGSVSTAQNAGVLEGYMTSSQIITAGSGTINALQATNLAGTLGYADGVVQSSDNIVHMTSGLNGVGGMSGFLATAASDGVRASGYFQAESLESKAYSAVKSISPHADAYTYISSAGHLESSMSGSANGHVTSKQKFDANGDVRVYATCTSGDSPTEIYDVEGKSVSGSMSASAGSPAVIDIDLVGDLQSSAAGVDSISAGIYNKGTLDLSGIVLKDNSATYGGGICNWGSLYLKDVSINKNVANLGGWLFSTNSQVTIDGTQVFVINNQAASPSPLEYSWHEGWGVYINSEMPTTTGGFDPTTQVTGNTLVS